MSETYNNSDEIGLRAAFGQALKSYSEGGIPIGSALVSFKDSQPKLIAASHNQRIQKSSAILHGETATLEEAGRLNANVYRDCTMVRRCIHYLIFFYLIAMTVHYTEVYHT